MWIIDLLSCGHRGVSAWRSRCADRSSAAGGIASVVIVSDAPLLISRGCSIGATSAGGRPGPRRPGPTAPRPGPGDERTAPAAAAITPTALGHGDEIADLVADRRRRPAPPPISPLLPIDVGDQHRRRSRHCCRRRHRRSRRRGDDMHSICTALARARRSLGVAPSASSL